MFWNSKREEKNEAAAAQAMVDFSADIVSAGYRRKLILWLGSALLASWILVLLLPNLIAGYLLLAGDSKILLMPFAAVFGISMYFAYALGVQMIPDLEENKTLESDVFESVVFQTSANRRIKVWTAAIFFGLANAAAMIGAAFLLNSYDLYLFEF